MSELVHFCKVNGPSFMYKTIHTYENDHWLIDTKGNKYLDTMSGCRTSILGHGVKSIKDAMKKQLDVLPYYPTVFHSYNSIAHKGTKILNQVFPYNTEIFYTPTGSLANESAIKFATKYWELNGEKSKKGICYMSKSYHGTTGLIGCTSDQPINKFMNLDLTFPGSKIDISFADEKINIEETLGYIEHDFKYDSHNIAAIIIDAISTSGLYSYNSYFWTSLRFLADKYQVLIILDEVVTGFGKTGYMFATDKWKIKADIITIGKGMANGYFPLAATICSKKITEKLDWLLHGMTFSSHPIGMAAFIENYRLLKLNIHIIKKRFNSIHPTLAQGLKSNYIKSIRTHGVLGGLTTIKDFNVRLVEEEGWKRGIIVYAGGGPKSTKLTWCLPITLSDEEIKLFFDTLQSIFDDFKLKEKGKV